MSMQMSFAAMRALLQSRLKPSRYEHSLGVAETAAKLARRFGVDEEQARVAGLLHDCAREYPKEQMLAEAVRRGIPFGAIEQSMPLLLHAYIGARRISELYEVDDEAIAQAIWRHTVGGPGMTRLDKIIWFADMIEPNREYPEVEELRRLAREATLDAMVLEGLSQSIAFVIYKHHLIHPDTVLARNELLLQQAAQVKESGQR